VIRGEKDETGILTVRTHRGESEVLSEESGTVTIEAHKVLMSEVAVSSLGDSMSIDVSEAGESEAGPYDFNGDGLIDDADIGPVSDVWNACEGDAAYNSLYDLDEDGCISVLDIMAIVNSDSAP